MELGLIIAMVILATVGGYIAASIFFLKFPQILHKRKKLKFRPLHISHRGGAGEKCENTMAAFRHALDQKTDMLELDCHLTKDGIVVVSHDQNLERRCGLEKNIAELEFAELPEYKGSLKLDFKSTFFAESGDDRKIPTLRDVFKAFPQIPINIDVKTHDEELIHKVNDLVKEYQREQLVIWGSRNAKTINLLKQVNPDVPTFFSIGRLISLVLLFYSGLLPFVPIPESSLEIVMPSIAAATGWNLSKKTRALMRVMDVLLMRPALFNHLSKRGIHTYLWVLNDETEWERAFKLGATGVTTDFPTSLREFLDKHPELYTTGDKVQDDLKTRDNSI